MKKLLLITIVCLTLLPLTLAQTYFKQCTYIWDSSPYLNKEVNIIASTSDSLGAKDSDSVTINVVDYDTGIGGAARSFDENSLDIQIIQPRGGVGGGAVEIKMSAQGLNEIGDFSMSIRSGQGGVAFPISNRNCVSGAVSGAGGTGVPSSTSESGSGGSPGVPSSSGSGGGGYACSDSDNGLDYNKKGTVTYSNGEVSTDYCVNDKTLVEYTCGEEKCETVELCPEKTETIITYSQLQIVYKTLDTEAIIDSESRGTTTIGITTNLDPGIHNLQFKKSGYKSCEKEVTLTAGNALKVEVTLPLIDSNEECIIATSSAPIPITGGSGNLICATQTKCETINKVKEYECKYGCSDGVCLQEPHEETESSSTCEKYYVCQDGKEVQYCFIHKLYNEEGELVGVGCGCKSHPESFCPSTSGSGSGGGLGVIKSIPGSGSGGSNSTPIFCDGCVLGDKCVFVGYRANEKYCELSGEFKHQKEADLSCENNFECDSNLCIDDRCVEKGLFKRILEFFQKLFGIKA